MTYGIFFVEYTTISKHAAYGVFMGKRENNQNRILALVKQKGRLGVQEAVKELDVSEATVRRYFADLEKDGLLIRVLGGVCDSVMPQARDYNFGFQASLCMDEKRAIGRAAADMIVAHDRVFFDSGTTVREVGNAIAERLSTEAIADLNIVTTSLVYNSTLTELCKFSLTGGLVRPSRMDLCGAAALNGIRRYNFTKAFLGADAISGDGVVMTMDEGTSLLASAAVEHSTEIFILADSGKIGTVSFVPYCSLESDRFTLVTDERADIQIVKKLRNKGIRVILTECLEKDKEM